MSGLRYAPLGTSVMVASSPLKKMSFTATAAIKPILLGIMLNYWSGVASHPALLPPEFHRDLGIPALAHPGHSHMV
jgi:hypothetical protein